MVKKEEMNKFQKYATICAFIVLIFVPSIAWMFCGDTIGDDDSENRKLAEMPEFDIEHIEDYPKEFDKYYSDHVPFRKNIKDVWTSVNYVVLCDSTTKDVIIGKNDGRSGSEAWLFYSKASDNNPVANVQGITDYSEKTIKKIDNNIANTTERLKEKGIEYYFFVAPNKENIYREYLPDSVTIFHDKSKDEKLIDALGTNRINIIYAKNEIMDAKSVGQLYYRQDTHWNNLGAFYGFKALMQEMEPKFKDYDYGLEYSSLKVHDKDLARFLGIKNYFMDTDAIVKYRDDSVIEIETSGNGDKKISTSVNRSSIVDKTVLLIGDSYRTALLPYLQKVYSKVVSIHRNGYERTFIDKYSPDIVVMETVERNTAVAGGFRVV